MIGTAVAIFIATSVLPLAYMVVAMLSGIVASDAPLSALLLDGRQRRLLYNTGLLGGATATLATLMGAPLGVVLARVDVPWKRTLRVLLAAPVLLPPYVAALAWVSLGSATGLLSHVIGRDALSAWTYSLPGAVLVLTLVWYPLSMLATEAAVRRIEPRLEEAALTVTTPRRVLWHITLPLAAPTIIAAFLVIFVLAVSEFGVPGLLQVRVFTTEVFTAFADLYDFDRATLVALPLLLLSTGVAAIAVTVAGDRLVATRRGATSTPVLLFGAWKPVSAVGAAIVVVLALCLPLAALLYEASGLRSWASTLQGSGTAIGNSLVLAMTGATLTTGVGVALGYARARARRGIGVFSDLACIVLFSVPSTIVGIGLIGLWNRRGLLGAAYGTDAMLLLAYLARFLPVATLGVAADVRHVPLSHEEAAATAGAGWLRTTAQIVVPQVGPSVLAMWIVVFVLAFGELGASILVAPPGETTLPIRIYTLIANAPAAQVAALSLLQAAVVLSPLMLLAWTVAARESR